MNPSRIDPSEGRFIGNLPHSNSRNCSRVSRRWIRASAAHRISCLSSMNLLCAAFPFIRMVY
jgi:hypothetical protein